MQLRDLNVCHLSDRIFPARIEAGAQRGSGRKSKKSKTSVCVYLGPVRANNGRGSRAPTRRSRIWLTCRCWTIGARLHTNEAAADQRPAGIDTQWTWFGSKRCHCLSVELQLERGQQLNVGTTAEWNTCVRSGTGAECN